MLGDITEGLTVQEAMDNITDIREIYDCMVKGEQDLDMIKERLTDKKRGYLGSSQSLVIHVFLLFRLLSLVKGLITLSVIWDRVTNSCL